jgi:hypothetical protein
LAFEAEVLETIAPPKERYDANSEEEGGEYASYKDNAKRT